MNDEFTIRPVGTVSNDVRDMVDENWGDVTSKIVLKPEYKGALDGLKDFSHAIILTYHHNARYVPEKHLKRRPRGIKAMPEVGLFSQRVKDRPNPIGVTVVDIVDVGEDYLLVRGLDAINQTPIVDIKPYYPHYDRRDHCRIPKWVDRLMENYF